MHLFVKNYLIVFALLTFAGGLIGFVKANSRASLIAGSASALLLFFAAWLLGTHTVIGLILGLAVSAALAARFIPALLKGGGFMPAGLMSALSLAGILITVLEFFHRP